jgi:hypothetical protein
MEATMLRGQVINFLEFAVVLLILTNVMSVAAAVYALAFARRISRSDARAADPGILPALPRWLQPGKPAR